MFTEELALEIFNKTAGRCVHCDKVLTFANRGRSGRGGWEIDHSVPKARGGTDHLNNLFPSRWESNIKKSTRSSRAHRAAVAYVRQKRTGKRRFRTATQAFLPALGIAAIAFMAQKPEAAAEETPIDQPPSEQEKLFWKRLLISAAVFVGVIALVVVVREISRRA